jgi:serine/threonine protein kinase
MDVYEIIKPIGSGTSGQVYLAKHKLEGKCYVIKKVKTRDMDEKEVDNTEREVKLLQKLRHPNIVGYKDSFVDREQFINIVMENCDGGELYTKSKNNNGKNFTEEQILEWFAEMALAIHYLHERRILHRDLKSQNIFLKNSKVKVGDFGISKVLDDTKDFANTIIGTPYYMAPEIFQSKPYKYKSDIWALGCILYELCNLKYAFNAQSINGLAIKVMKGSYPPINTMYSKELRDLIGKLLI